ncbi:MAG: hypothetical protein J7K68_04850 [Candidatus Diapherotrites archaeon]|nr:hypothetical protein [Candidatus Diapherotrites archaeon]
MEKGQLMGVDKKQEIIRKYRPQIDELRGIANPNHPYQRLALHIADAFEKGELDINEEDMDGFIHFLHAFIRGPFVVDSKLFIGNTLDEFKPDNEEEERKEIVNIFKKTYESYVKGKNNEELESLHSSKYATAVREKAYQYGYSSEALILPITPKPVGPIEYELKERLMKAKNEEEKKKILEEFKPKFRERYVGNILTHAVQQHLADHGRHNLEKVKKFHKRYKELKP